MLVLESIFPLNLFPYWYNRIDKKLKVEEGELNEKRSKAAYFSAAPTVTEYSKFSVFLGRIESVHFPAAP